MDLVAVGWDGFEVMCKQNSGGKEKGRRVNQKPTMDLGERSIKDAWSNLPEFPNTTFTVVICWVSNVKDIVLAPKQLQTWYTNVR